MSASRLLGLMITSSWLLVGCSPAKKIDVGGSCVLNSDCNQSLVCTWGKCHEPCHTSVDCPTGESCITASDQSKVCQLPIETHCLYDSDCPTSLKCAVDLRCHNQCQTNGDCLSGQTCTTTKTCAEPNQVDSNNNLIGTDGGVGGCPVGSETCPCYPNDTCNTGLTCASSLCVSLGTGGSADAGICPTGSETCPCYANDTCNSGLTCASHLCVGFGAGGSGGGSGGRGDSGVPDAFGAQPDVPTGGPGGPGGGRGGNGGGGGGSTGSGGTGDSGVPDAPGAQPDVPVGGSGTTSAGGASGSGGAAGSGGGSMANGGGGGATTSSTGGTTSSPAGTTGSTGSGGGGKGDKQDAGASEIGDAVGTGGTDSGGCTASNAGAPACVATVGTGSPGLIDDFSSGEASILPNDGRKGFWKTANDGTGIQTPAPFAASCARALPSGGKICTSGSGFKTWGAFIGLTLNEGQNCAVGLYDASAYTGITFTVSGTIQSGYFRFRITTASTLSQKSGGTCPPTSTCDDYYGVDLTPATTPQTFTYHFPNLRQEGWGTPVAWNSAEMLSASWQVSVNTDIHWNPTGTAAFADICIYDVSFF